MKDSQDDSLKAFEKYYQREYDYDTTALSEPDINQIRQLAMEKRVLYGMRAPIGENIFDLISSQNPSIRYESIDFNSDDVDAILYICSGENAKSYIVLNSKRPLVNQIFATAHEYYHFIHDYEEIKKNPCICDFKSLDSLMEKRASRFAAELLLPTDALKAEIQFYEEKLETKQMDFDLLDYGALSIFLLTKYQLPLKSIFYRFHEEGLLKKAVEEVIQDYELIKRIVNEIVGSEMFDVINRLYSSSNPHISNESLEYKQIRNAYDLGNASREEILEDSRILNLDESHIASFFDSIEEDDEELSPEQLKNLSNLWRK